MLNGLHTPPLFFILIYVYGICELSTSLFEINCPGEKNFHKESYHCSEDTATSRGQNVIV